MKKVASAEIAAVAVTASRRMLWTQSMYSLLLSQTGSSSVAVHTHVPPVSATMDALTAII